MRILVLTQYIYPETFRSSDLVFELAKRGHHVDVLTGIPNYPEGRYYNGYGIFKRRKESIRGVRFYRCFQTPRKLLPSFAGLGLNYLSFVVSASIWILAFFVWKKKYDVIITHEPSPITQILPAIMLGKIRNIPVLSWIMDIWPDSVTDSVGKQVAYALRPLLNFITQLVYRSSDKLLISSQGFRPFINRQYDFSSKIIYFPNWSEDMMVSHTDCTAIPLPKGFRIMIAGNLGDAQDLETVADVILQLREFTEIKWFFVGDGSKKAWLDDFIRRNNLTHTAYLLGRHQPASMPGFFKQADAMMVSLAGGYPFLDATVPARLQAYMSAGRPVLAMIGSGGRAIINEARCGFAVASGDSTAMAETIKRYVLPNQASFELMGKNGRLYFEENFIMEDCVSRLEKIIHDCIHEKGFA